MAFPTIPTAGASQVLFQLATSPSGTHTSPSLTTLANNAGDLLIAIVIIYDGNSTNAEFSAWGGGFTEFADQAGTATMGIGAAYKFSNGTETGTFTVTSADASTNDSCFILLSIPAAHAVTPPEAGTMAVGTAPDSGALNPAGWGTEDTLWISVGASGEDALTGSFTGIGTAPTNYTNQADSGISADAIGGVEGSVAFRQLNAASEDPGTWSMDTSNARGASLLIAIRPRNDISVTPGTATLTLSPFAPTVTALAPVLVTPGLATLALTRFAPTVQAPRLSTPGTATLTLTPFTPTVTVSAGGGVTVTPGAASLTLTAYAPSVSAPRLVTPGLATLALTRFTPTVQTPRLVTPGTVSLTLTRFAPTVATPRLATPGTGHLTLTRFAPTVATPRLATPGTAALTLTTFTPSAVAGGGEVSGGIGPRGIAYHLFPDGRASGETPASRAPAEIPAGRSSHDTPRGS